ncbi:MAG: enoyl-CoA hydratase-related protein [Gammaproteobacteria bacterium]|nr:enoyl-CoA hydratase-related protein [Gammaproteobacteria bacterium]
MQWGALPRLVNLVGPARAKRICILCEQMNAPTALDWGLVDEVAADGKTVEKALEMARTVVERPAVAVAMIKEGVNAIAGALNHTASYADADQSQLSAATDDARNARDRFNKER